MKKLLLLTILLALQIEIMGQSSESRDSEGRFGVCSHPFAPREIDIREPLFDKMKDAGVQWLRTDFVWGKIVPTYGKYNFKVYDEIVDSLAGRGIKVLGILTEARAGMSATKNQDKWIEYIKATVSHFKGRVKYWEVINEHDIHEPYKYDGGAELYGKNLKAAYKAIKEANPDAVVLYGGLASSTVKSYFDKTLKVAGNSSYDIMNFHTYPAPGPTEIRQKKCLDNLRAVMRANGGEKPIWLTEIGSSTPPYSDVSLTILKKALERLDLKDRKIYALDNITTSSLNLARDLFPEASKIYKTSYSEISKLSPNSVFVMGMGQHFPSNYVDDLINFIRSGGTVIYPGGGYPFYYDSESGAHMGGRVLNRLHGNIKPHWEYPGKMPASVGILNSVWADEINGGKLQTLNMDRQKFRCFNYDSSKLEGGDKFIPLVCVTVDGHKLNVACIYKYNSDLKGNLICVSTNEGTYVTERGQAAFLARDYIYAFSQGIEKVFKYNFRSHGEVSPYEGHFGMVRKDLSEKPAYHAYRTVIKLLGNNAKPKYVEKDGFCRADWTSPTGERVCAFWCFDIDNKPSIEVSMDAKPFKILNVRGKTIYESKGETAENITLKPTIAPQYIVGGRVLATEPGL